MDVTLGWPLRYSHSPAEVIDTKDRDDLEESWKQSRGSGDERRARVRQRGNRKGPLRSFEEGREASGNGGPGEMLAVGEGLLLAEAGAELGIGQDAAKLSPIPIQRSATVAECDRLQPGQSVAAAGAAEGDRDVALDDLAARTGEDRRAVGQTCSLLLAAVGGELSGAAPVWKHAAADCGFAAASQIGAAARRKQSGQQREVDGEVSEKSLENKAIPGFCVPETTLFGLPEPLGWKRMQETDPAGQLRVYWLVAVNAKRKFRLTAIAPA